MIWFKNLFLKNKINIFISHSWEYKNRHKELKKQRLNIRIIVPAFVFFAILIPTLLLSVSTTELTASWETIIGQTAEQQAGLNRTKR